MKTRVLHHFERVINRVLALDPALSDSLSELHGKVISLEFINTDIVIYVMPNEEGLSLCADSEGDVHVRIRATPADMLAYVISARDDGQVAGNLEIVGDVGLAQHFQNIMKDIDLDWEEQLSQWVGDTAARKLSLFGKRTLKFLWESKRTFEMNISEYLLYEKEALPVKTEVDDFISSVDNLRNDVERMKIRIDRLQRRVLT